VISFVVPAYNEERLIGATLDAIHAAARDIGAPYEVVVANDSSTDRTPDIAREHGARVVDCHHRQIARVRNTGARATTGDVLIFVDADTLISTAVVRASLAALGRGAVGGGSLPDIEGRMPWWGPMVLLAVDRVMRLMRWAAGCCVFVTRAAFEAVGGFDETLYASEELTLCRALRRWGAFVILRESVLTSGRKVRSYSGREILRDALSIAFAGRAGVRDRSRLRIWYEPRRPDPAEPR